MSSTATPITPARFAAALKDLTLASLYAKASEIRNSIAHLRRSNDEMQVFVDQGDSDFAEYIWDNLAVIKRHEERLELLRHEVEERGLPWVPVPVVVEGDVQPGRLSPGPEDEDEGSNVEAAAAAASTTTTTTTTRPTRAAGGSLGDEELARRLAERMQEDMNGDGEEDEGVHL